MSCEIIPNTPCPTQHDEYCLHPPNPQDEEQGIIEPKLVHEETDDPRNETPSANADSCLPHSNIQESPDESPDIVNEAENNNDFCEEEDESALCVICLDTIGMSSKRTYAVFCFSFPN